MKRQTGLLKILKCFLLSLALAAVGGGSVGGSGHLRAQTPGDASTTVNSSSVIASPAPYRVGEKLTYTVSFSNFPIAAHLETWVAGRTNSAGGDRIELRGHVETVGVVSVALYSINNDYVSYVEPASGLPLRTEQVLREGTGTANAARDYNQPLGASAFPARQTTGGFPGTYDFLSALYRLRSLPLTQGGSYNLTVQGGAELYEAELRVTGRELLKTNIGSVNAIVTQARVRNNQAANNYRLRVYFSDDARHVPVLFTAQHPSGEIRAEIASADFVDESPTSPLVSVDPLLAPDNTSPQMVVPPGGNAEATPRTPAAVVPNVPTANVGASLADLPFRVGEQLNFSFFLGNSAQPVGTAAFQVRARARYFNREGLLLTSLLGTTGAGQTLFPTRDQISSYVDATTLLPFRTELRLQEGRRRANWTVNADQDRGSAVFDDGTRLEIPVGTHDLVSVLYALRSFDLTPPKRNAVSILINKRPRALFITSIRRETIQVGGQSIPAVQLSLITDEAQGDRLQLRLWVSTDRRRLPLRLTAVTPVGPVRADLAIIPTALQ